MITTANTLWLKPFVEKHGVSLDQSVNLILNHLREQLGPIHNTETLLEWLSDGSRLTALMRQSLQQLEDTTSVLNEVARATRLYTAELNRTVRDPALE